MVGQFTPTVAATETATYALSSNATNSVPPHSSCRNRQGPDFDLHRSHPDASRQCTPQYGQGITVAAKVTLRRHRRHDGTITFKVDGVAGLPVLIVYASGVATASVAISSQSVTHTR